jgi:hypothetical protein
MFAFSPRSAIARDMSPEAARRAAENRITFVNVSWLDVKLGIRILAKYPGSRRGHPDPNDDLASAPPLPGRATCCAAAS